MKKVIIYIVIFAMLLISLVFVNSYVKAISKEQRFNDCPYNEKYPICQQDGNCMRAIDKKILEKISHNEDK